MKVGTPFTNALANQKHPCRPHTVLFLLLPFTLSITQIAYTFNIPLEIKLCMKERKRERELCGSVWKSQPHQCFESWEGRKSCTKKMFYETLQNNTWDVRSGIRNYEIHSTFVEKAYHRHNNSLFLGLDCRVTESSIILCLCCCMGISSPCEHGGGPIMTSWQWPSLGRPRWQWRFN